MKTFVPAVLALFVFSQPALAGNCGLLFRQKVVQQQVVYAQPVVAAQYINPYAHYRVGQSIEDDANRKKLAREIADLVLAGLKTPAAAAPAAPEPGVLQLKAPVLTAKCAKCHTGEGAKGGVKLDGSEPVSIATRWRIIEILGDGVNVPKAMVPVVNGLTAQDKGAITHELISQGQPAAEAPPAPAAEPGTLE